MSLKAIAYADAVIDAAPAGALSVTERYALTVIADYTNAKTGTAWPSGATIARRMGITPRSVWRVLAGLKAKGYLISERRQSENGDQDSSEYRLTGFAPVPNDVDDRTLLTRTIERGVSLGVRGSDARVRQSRTNQGTGTGNRTRKEPARGLTLGGGPNGRNGSHTDEDFKLPFE